MKIKRILKYVMMKYGSVTSKQTKTTRVSNVLIRPYDVVSFNYNTGSSTQSISYDNTVDFKVSLNSVTSSNATLTLQGPNRHSVKTNLKGELHIHFPDGLYTYSALDLSGNTASGTFSVPTTLTGTVSIPAAGSLIQSWYDALSVKPSAGLWADLNTLVNGLNSDGDWTEADFISLNAGVETQQQAFSPLKTSGLTPMTPLGDGDITWSINGFIDNTGNFASGIDSRYNPNTNKIKFATNSAFVGHYFNLPLSGGYAGFAEFGIQTFDSFSMYFNIGNVTDTSVDISGRLNNNTVVNVSKTDFSSLLDKNVFLSLTKTSTNIQGRINNTLAQVSKAGLDSIPQYPYPICSMTLPNASPGFVQGIDPIPLRFTIIGSSLIDHNRVAARLNTFFASRGLSISNY